MISKKHRILAGIFAGIMALSVIVPTISMLVRAEDDFSDEHNKIADLSSKYKELEAQQKKIQAQLSQTKSEKDKQLAVKQQLGTQIDMTKEQIDVLSERIDLLGENIVQKEEEMVQKQSEIDANYELFLQRVNAMAKIPNASMLGVALGAQSYCQFVNRTEIMNRVATHDNVLINDLKEEKEELEQIKKQIESDRVDVEEDKKSMDAKKEELSSHMAQTQKQIEDISLLEQQFIANQAAMQAQMKQVQKEIDSIYTEIARKSTLAQYVGGEMLMPTPNLTQITSNYGYRFNGSDFHTGVDFAGSNAFGQSVLAANSGTVAKVNLAVTPGYGYGKYVIIDHGGGVTTLYAHNSAVLVSEGDKVSRGQPIAQIGMTGWATGPHCHFEVRINGQHQNPMPYLTGK